ncbi:MAG: branched-chain amino acid ABC transporter permease [Rhodospirillum sp.]|nr:branched-chain amino acid ABC transporter permease [Rhodospirillum sp.]MCF8490075.1 branched-chain amino acid ABC transporter permease [Rhodospirillum sp.]MCF8500434.1 branched-chain amino acid ABC transporter permease [Rhodospirillum sp.]
MIDWINTLIQGLLTGGLYALFAVGLSLAFGVMRLVNIAHGDLIILAAYLALVAVEATGMPALAALLVVVPAMALFGYGLQRGLLVHTVGKGLLSPLLVTFGLSIILQNLMLEIFSADSRGVQAGLLETLSLEVVDGITVGVLPLLILASAVVVVGGLQLLFSHTGLGRSFKATSDDPETASLMGIDPKRVYALAMGLAMAIVAIAGVYTAIRTSFDPLNGPSRLLFAFEAVIIGGLGSLWGTLAGGLILGLSQAIGFRLDPGWGILASHLTFLAVLVVRPNGLFPRTRDR